MQYAKVGMQNLYVNLCNT